MWVIDIRHMLDDNQSGPAIPRLKLKVQKLAEIITYATAKEAGASFAVQPFVLEETKEKALSRGAGDQPQP